VNVFENHSGKQSGLVIMEKNYLMSIMNRGEGISVEFKSSRSKLNKDVFESVCAFLNRHGGHLFLGIENDRTICGVDDDAVYPIINNFITTANNPQKLFPPFYLSPEIFEIDNKKIIYVYVPESSQVHKTAGKIFDRNDDGDLNVTENTSHIARLYLRKQTTYSENTIFPFATLEDLRSDLIARVKIRAKNENGGSHPWFEMTDKELLLSSQLFKKDLQTGKEGLTLAAILIFGKDETILNALPHYKTDAILRIRNINRYDDRDDIRTNLIESHERLMAFVAKHLPDPFFLEENVRVSLRNKIFREAIGNILIHREYSHAFPAKMIIEPNQVVFENANRPHGYGLIDPNTFTPFPKNPIIARLFKEIGFADELGSGVRNLFKYTAIYSQSGNPQLIEDDIFKIIIPITEQVTEQDIEKITEQVTEQVTEQDIEKITEQATEQATEQDIEKITEQATEQVTEQATEQVTEQATEQDIEKITEQVLLKYCMIPRSTKEIMDFARLKHREHFRSEILKPLLERKLLFMTIPEKPNSPKQKYYSKKNEFFARAGNSAKIEFNLGQ
jgi:ATP-dependent DNA helicase RecG